MTDNTLSDTTNQVLERFDTVIQHRQMISERLKVHSVSFAGKTRRHLLQLSRFFELPLKPLDLVQHPSALIMSESLLTAHQNEGNTGRQWDIHGVDEGLRVACSKIANAPQSNGVGNWLWLYPLFLMLAALALLTFYSFYVIPDFEKMFDEFGLQVPPDTQLTFLVASFARRFGVWILAMLVLGLVYGMTVVWERGKPFPSLSSRPRFQGFKSNHTSWTQWAYHVAALLECGIAQRDAIQLAADAHSSRVVKHDCAQWLVKIGQGEHPFRSAAGIRNRLVARMVHALGLPTLGDQAAVLRDIAVNDHELRDSYRSWWWAWLSPVMAGVIGTSIGLMVYSLLTPLISLISGLT